MGLYAHGIRQEYPTQAYFILPAALLGLPLRLYLKPCGRIGRIRRGSNRNEASHSSWGIMAQCDKEPLSGSI